MNIRTDLPRYAVFVDGQLVDDPTDLNAWWRGDLVSFAFGCSFSLEELFRRAGVDLAYERRGFGGAIYETCLETRQVGPFGGRLVTSMRPLRPKDAISAVTISTAYPALHGAPVHLGLPDQLGVRLEAPLHTLGEVSVADDELPVFWACGVTTQRALELARPPLAITHWSGHMLVTDRTLDEVRQWPNFSTGNC